MTQLGRGRQSIDYFTWTTYAEPEHLKWFALALAYRDLVRRMVGHLYKQECRIEKRWKEPEEGEMGGWKVEVWVDETDTD